MSDTPDIDKYENADWWTVFRATQLCRELKQERDEARREIKELKRAAIEVLKVVPVAHCSEMYHGKRDMHFLGPCPVVERYNAKIDKLRALLKEEAK